MLRNLHSRRVRLTTTGIILSTLACLTTACSSSAGTSGKNVLTVAYAGDYLPMTPQLGVSWWSNIKKEFEAAHPGVTVKVDAIPGGYNDFVTKLNLRYRNPSTAPDVALVPNELLGTWVTAGELLPLNKYLPSAPWWSTFPKAVQEQTTIDGKVYAVNQGENLIGLWYNIPMFRKAGIPVPWQPTDWADIIAAAQKVKAAVPNAWPLYLIGGTGAGTSGFQYSAANLLLGSSTPEAQDPSTKKWIVDSPGIRQVLEFYRTIATDHLGAPESVALDPNSVYNLFSQMAKQKMAIAINGNWLGEAWVKSVCAPCWPNGNKIMGSVAIPTATGTGRPNVASTLGGWDLAIASASPNPSLAWQFIQLAQGPKNMMSAALMGAFTPPDESLATSNTTYLDLAAPYNAYYAKVVLPAARALSVEPGYTVWATGFEQATGAIIQNPGTAIDQAVNVMKSYITGQLGQSEVETVK